MWKWIKQWILLGWLFDLYSDDNGIKKVKIGNRIFAPLFYSIAGMPALFMSTADEISGYIYQKYFSKKSLKGLDASTIRATWDYMKKTEEERKFLRDYIKNRTLPDETPAITFILTPYEENGHTIPDDMSGVSNDALNVIRAMCEENVKDGIAVFLCLYVDDHAPRWMDINNHREVWKKVHKKVGDIVNGYILSIEANEKATSKGHIENCVNIIREVMPGADYYSVHLQWKANNGRYCWTGGATTPTNINVVWVEYSWNPDRGDAVGLGGLKNEYGAINHNNQQIDLVHQEWNLKAGGSIEAAQRAYLRSQRAWGIG